MRKWFLFLSSIAAIAVAGHVFAESKLPRGLVGFSSGTARGDAGMLVLTTLCQTDFPTSRMCTSKEVLATQTIPTTLPGGVAWVQPTIVPSGQATDLSGVPASVGQTAPYPPALSCGGWTPSASETGLALDGQGHFALAACALPQHVACCAGQPELLGDIDQNGKLDLADDALLRRYLAGETSALPG